MLSTSFPGRESVVTGFMLPPSRFQTTVLINPILMFRDGQRVHPLWLASAYTQWQMWSRVTVGGSFVAPIGVRITEENLPLGIRLDEQLSQ